MTAGQTVYNTKQPTAFAGMRADIDGDDVVSRVNVDAVAFPFGVAVVEVSGHETQMKLPATGNDLVIGILAHAHDYPTVPALTTTLGLPIASIGNVVKRGRVWCLAQLAVNEGDDVYVRYTASGGFAVGSLSNASDAGKNGKLVGAKWASTQATPGGLALVEINLIGSKGALT